MNLYLLKSFVDGYIIYEEFYFGQEICEVLNLRFESML